MAEIVRRKLRPMSNPQAPSRSKARSTRRGAEIIDVEVVKALRDAKLTERALAGDVDASIRWPGMAVAEGWHAAD
jgi:hypothetical protein